MTKEAKTRAYTVLISGVAALYLAWFVLSADSHLRSPETLWLQMSIFVFWGLIVVLGLLGHGENIKARDFILIGIVALIFSLAGRLPYHRSFKESFALIYLTLICLVAATK